MKNMSTIGLKGIGAAIVFYVSWINQNFTPLFWVLLILITLDLVLNAHKEGQQFTKIGSMAVTLGVPGYIAANVSNPNLGKYIVAIMCLVYLQIVVPSLIAWVSSWKGFSGKPQDQAALEALVQKVAALEQSQAEKVLQGSGAPEPIKESQGGK
jgi:predicted permease